MFLKGSDSVCSGGKDMSQISCFAFLIFFFPVRKSLCTVSVVNQLKLDTIPFVNMLNLGLPFGDDLCHGKKKTHA